MVQFVCRDTIRYSYFLFLFFSPPCAGVQEFVRTGTLISLMNFWEQQLTLLVLVLARLALLMTAKHSPELMLMPYTHPHKLLYHQYQDLTCKREYVPYVESQQKSSIYDEQRVYHQTANMISAHSALKNGTMDLSAREIMEVRT